MKFWHGVHLQQEVDYGGGRVIQCLTNTIDFVTIATTSNALILVIYSGRDGIMLVFQMKQEDYLLVVG